VFDGRKVLPVILAVGPVLGFLSGHLDTLTGEMDLRATLASCIIAAYTWLAAYEFWRGRSEPLVSRWPAIFMLFAHGSLFLLRTPLGAVLSWLPTDRTFDNVWLTVLSFETLLFTIAIAFIFLAMAKERTEYRHRRAAMIDPLTGIANRRSFLDEAHALASQRGANPVPMAVMLIDLDLFKSVNDRFGHPLGDRVLQIFTNVAMATLRASDLIGRVGGEEFAVVLQNVNREKAVTLAEQVRCAFAEAASEVDGYPVGASLSIGMVLTQTADRDIGALLAQADQALYHAKERGRNRVEVAAFDARKRPGSIPPLFVAAKTAA
jgi:diguanylate cyclase (GGDEF)-like protein